MSSSGSCPALDLRRRTAASATSVEFQYTAWQTSGFRSGEKGTVIGTQTALQRYPSQAILLQTSCWDPNTVRTRPSAGPAPYRLTIATPSAAISALCQVVTLVHDEGSHQRCQTGGALNSCRAVQPWVQLLWTYAWLHDAPIARAGSASNSGGPSSSHHLHAAYIESFLIAWRWSATTFFPRPVK